MPADTLPVCAVTGAGGYLGGVIAAHLEDHGFSVRRLSRANGYCLDRPISSSVFSPGTVEALIHCAYDFSVSSWEATKRVNVEGSLRLFDAADRAGVRRIIFLSSLAAYEGCVSLYGRGKLAVEAAVFARGGHVIRPGTVFGTRSSGMMGSLSTQVRTRDWIPVLRHPGALYLVHDVDLAVLVAELIRSTSMVRSVPWLAAGPRAWTLGELVQELARRAGRVVRLVPVPWRLAWAALRAAEMAGFRPSFRSDSVLSLAHPIPSRQLAGLQQAPFAMADF